MQQFLGTKLCHIMYRFLVPLKYNCSQPLATHLHKELNIHEVQIRHSFKKAAVSP